MYSLSCFCLAACTLCQHLLCTLLLLLRQRYIFLLVCGVWEGCRKQVFVKEKERKTQAQLKTQEIPPFLAGWRRVCWVLEMCPARSEVECAFTKSLLQQIPIIWTQKNTKTGGQNFYRHTHKHKHTNKHGWQELGQCYSSLRPSTSKICVSECSHTTTKSHAQTHLLILQTVSFRPSSFHAQSLGVSTGLQFRGYIFLVAGLHLLHC